MRALEELKKDFKEALSHIDFSEYDPYSKTFMKALFIGQLLMAVKEMEDDVDEELDGARNYWNKYLETNDVQFKEMAHDELKHAGILIKKHLATADDSEKAYLNGLEKERQEMLKLVGGVV